MFSTLERRADAIAGLDADWRRHAQCAARGVDPAVFFTPDNELSGRGHGAFTWERAKAHCVGCPVEGECLEYALAAPEPVGVWGGRDENERRQILRRRASNRVA